MPADSTGVIFPGLNAESVMWPTDVDSRNHRIIEFGFTKDNLEIFNALCSIRFVGRYINDYTTEVTSRTNTDYSVYNPQGVLSRHQQPSCLEPGACRLDCIRRPGRR